MQSNLMIKNAGMVARAEAARLGMPIPPTFRFSGRTLVLSTGERFEWKQGSGWVRPDGSRADGRAPEVRCNCESAVCPAVEAGQHRESRCYAPVPEDSNLVEYIGECCDACFPHYRDAGYAYTPWAESNERQWAEREANDAYMGPQ